MTQVRKLDALTRKIMDNTSEQMREATERPQPPPEVVAHVKKMMQVIKIV